MPSDSSPVPDKIDDPDLRDWLAGDSGEPRELIVEANVPLRKVAFGQRLAGRAVPSGIESGSADERAASLDELRALLADKLGLPANVLRSAGAVVVRATSQQVRQFADHPSVRAIRPNRRLR